MKKLEHKIEELKRYKKLSNIEERISKFLTQFGVNQKEKDLFVKLIENYIYLDRVKQIEILKNFYEDIYVVKKMLKEETYYSVIKSKTGVKNSSNTLLEEYKLECDIENQFSIDLGYYKFKGKNLIFFDDVVGSGKTVTTFLKTYEEDLKDATVYLYVFFITKQGEENIKNTLNKLNINLTIVKHKLLNKCLDEIFKEDSKNTRKIIREHGRKIYSIKEPIMGFMGTEIILSTFRNTPNNTIVHFRKDTDKWQSLFPRNKKVDRLEIKENSSGIERKNFSNQMRCNKKND